MRPWLAFYMMRMYSLSSLVRVQLPGTIWNMYVSVIHVYIKCGYIINIFGMVDKESLHSIIVCGIQFFGYELSIKMGETTAWFWQIYLICDSWFY